MNGSFWMVCGSFSGLVSVAMGAFGAHALSEKLSPKMLAVFHTAAQYQMFHALALLALGIFAKNQPHISISAPGWCFLIGTVFFSGSLYALALTDIKILGAITPIGGVLFLAGWLTLALISGGWMGGGRTF